MSLAVSLAAIVVASLDTIIVQLVPVLRCAVLFKAACRAWLDDDRPRWVIVDWPTAVEVWWRAVNSRSAGVVPAFSAVTDITVNSAAVLKSVGFALTPFILTKTGAEVAWCCFGLSSSISWHGNGANAQNTKQ